MLQETCIPTSNISNDISKAIFMFYLFFFKEGIFKVKCSCVIVQIRPVI